jgi:hypothetical protein
VWPRTWADRSADMVRADLEAAKIPYSIDSPTGPLGVDFHALRYSYVAGLRRAGAPLELAAQLARHFDTKLTALRYGRAQAVELADAVKRMRLGSDEIASAGPLAQCDGVLDRRGGLSAIESGLPTPSLSGRARFS